ncbi:conserved unknown protein [Ectocarpus siliculosus]|uniref:Uncharacterized protein n=1 Tax=Ectocarpus siliculosus TaxID=2880 RepID=D8LKX1_ECTSI|nr:conserved unknown protein [Ectocarpus siliculosus]|eukprot:CBN80104.1 conserved unknown protein [Ectocarpus siliculosus]
MQEIERSVEGARDDDNNISPPRGKSRHLRYLWGLEALSLHERPDESSGKRNHTRKHDSKGWACRPFSQRPQQEVSTMLAQLLGMGRKKEKEKDSSKDSSHGTSSTAVTAADGKRREKGSEEHELGVAAADGALSPGTAVAAATAVDVEKAAMVGQTPGAAHSLLPPSAPTLPHYTTPNSRAAAGGAKAITTAAVGRCQEESSREAAGVAATTAAATGTAAAAGQGESGALVASGRSLAPSPPVGPAAFASPAAPSALVPQPLGQKAFSSEAAAVERGLHIQLGDTGAKTESQLGGQQLEAAKRLRHLLSTNRERMVQEMLSRGWVPLLLRWLGLVHRPSLQVEALSALTTVAQTTTEHTPLLLKHGAVGTLVNLLKSPSLEMVEQAMWVLGKLAQDGQDGTTARDAVLQAGVLGPLVRCLEQHQTLLSLQRIGAWSLFNLLDGQPRPTVDVATVNMVMPAINRLLMAGDSEVLCHACSALSHLCDGSAAHIKVVVESGVCKRLVQLLDHPSSQVVKPALRTIGNVVCAEDDADYTEAILEAGSVVCLKKLIAHPNREIQKEACWTLSNIAAGSVSQIQSVLDSGAMPQLIKLATSPETESEVRSEAFWVVLNAASCGSDAQIEYLVSQGCVQILSDLLGESSMVMMALEGIERVLSVGDLRVMRNAIASHSHADPDQGGDGAGGHGEGEGEGDHCMECASMEAVGAAAAAANARDGHCATEALAGGEAGAYTNPYACMLTPEKIQALEAHKNSAVAKRASRVWARYFVTCAICRGFFSRHGSSATFCAECNCHVCGSCDCTVFHLAYQDKLWEEMEGKEERGKKAQQAAKKNKKAKKREKKKNAAKELAIDPLPKEAKAAGGGGGGRGAGGDKPAAAPPGGVKRAGKAGGKDKDKASDGEKAMPGQRSPGLGKKGHDRSSSPNKASSSASTESNSEDEYSPSSPRDPKYHDNRTSPATSTAAAIINATAAAVNSAAAAAAAKKSGAGRRTTATAATTTTTTPPKKPPLGRAQAAVAAVTPTAPSPEEEEEERGQRRPGKKQGRRDPQQPAAVGRENAAAVAANRWKGSPTAAASRALEDDGEEPWVVVGGTGGKRAGGTKWNKGHQQQRAAAAPAPPVGSGGGGSGGTSSVVWASESSPANVAVPAATLVRSSAVASPPPATAAAATGTAPRVSVPSPSHVQVVPPGGGGPGGAWGGAGVVKPAVPPAVSSRPVGTPSSTTAKGVLRQPVANGSQFAPQRQGPGPGSVWGASSSIMDARHNPLSVAPPASSASSPAAAAAGSSLGAPFAGLPAAARAPGPSNRAGVIGSRPQATATTVAAAAVVAKPVGPSSRGLPTANALSPTSTTVGSRVTTTAASVNSKGGTGVAGTVSSSGGVSPAGVAIPWQEAPVGGGSGSSSANSSSSVSSLFRSASTGSEALIENEKLVSFLLETGSILALARRLEEEEDWRRPVPSSINSRPG